MATTNRDARRPDGPNLLPAIQTLTASLRRYDSPRVFYVGPERREIREAVEIDIQTNRPIPAQAITPALYVADVEVDEYEQIGRNTYRFFGIEPQRLRPGAPIFFAYPWQPVEHRVRTRFSLRLDGPLVS